MVPCGTGLSIYTTDQITSAASGLEGYDQRLKPFKDFEGWSLPEQVQNYRALVRRSLSTEESKLFFDACVPEASISLLFERLGGHFKPIAEAMERSIEMSEPNGWKCAVDDTERRLVSFEFSEEPGNLRDEIIRLEKKIRDNTVSPWSHEECISRWKS